MPETKPKADNNCVFCQKEITGKSFYTKGNFAAIYNIAPVLPGHSLIIPLQHHESLEELSDAELGEMMVFARKVTVVLKPFFGCTGFDWTIQDGEPAGQTIPHLHLHIIPRKPFDLPGESEWYSKIPGNEKTMLESNLRERLSDYEYNRITKKLSEAFMIL